MKVLRTFTRIVFRKCLKPKVHNEIKEGFRIIRKLPEHSYFEYQFYDETVAKSLVILEMALRIRY